jgi:hypothetical protein
MQFGPAGSLRRPGLWLAAACMVTSVVGLAVVPTSATTAGVLIHPGELQFIGGTPGDIHFNTVDLTGSDTESTIGTLSFDVSDATGSGMGWKIQGVGSTFSDGSGHYLPAGAISVLSAPRVACDLGSACDLATDSVAYPYILPAGNGATAATLFDAAPGSGMGNETVTSDFTLSLPASTLAASYTATWSFTLISGP